MAVQTQNYQCPKCTGPLTFKAELGKLKCEHCDSAFDVAEMEAMYAPQTEPPTASQPGAAPVEQSPPIGWGQSKLNSDWGTDADHMRAYNCTSCGAEIICDDTTAATSCIYCGNPTVIPTQFAGALRPDYVIPFRISKEQATAALKKHCENRMLLPKSFKSDAHLEEIKGVYVPFWLFDGSVYADVHYKASSSTTHTSGDYRITTTKHYDIQRTGTVEFRDIPLDASSKMPDIYMESIEPYDYASLMPFAMSYMPGYLADKFDVSIEQCTPRADERAANTALGIMRGSVKGYNTISEVGRSMSLTRGEVEYAMAPVWMLTTRWRGKVYLFAMNGQTGKFVGDLPCDWGKFWGMLLGLSALVGPLLYLIYLFLR